MYFNKELNNLLDEYSKNITMDDILKMIGDSVFEKQKEEAITITDYRVEDDNQKLIKGE